MKKPKTKKPKVGDEIYIPTSLHISRGSDDVQGGLATISDVSQGISGGELTWFVGVKEELKKKFGKSRAYPDPDVDTPWIQEGDIVNGQKYHGPDIW
jgi:hypothetical protein